ncbi:MAG TPA: tetratricopeptide repeat protein [Clostridia bacterium]|nr:tetratricopeptide repeat protein [Clostridia bacterium]
MRKNIVLALFLALAAIFTVSAAAQTTDVKGRVLDEAGNPIVNSKVVLQNVENGRKVELKTNNKGEYFTMGLTPGRYNIALLGQDGKPIFQLSGVMVKLSGDNIYDMNLQAERAKQQEAVPEEVRKQMEAQQKEAQKIKGLNAMLSQALEARKAGNCDQAIDLMQQATQADATKDLLWVNLAESYVCAKRFADAIPAYQKAIAIAPTRGEYHNNLGQALLKNNQVDEAIASYDKAAQLDPVNAAMYYFNEGAVLTNKGRADDAVKAFDNAIKADPNKADAYYWKGVNLLAKATIAKDGKMVAPEGTAEAFNKYLELQPEGQFAEPSKEMLKTIGAKVETTFGKGKKAASKK